MLKNYFKIAFRNLVKNRIYSVINIGGLAVGMSVAMLIGLWIYDELSFNKSHENYDRIGQIYVNQNFGGEKSTWSYLPYPYINELKSNYKSNFKHIVVSTNPGENILTAGENKLSRNGMFIEPDAPEMFSFKMLKGTWKGLSDPQSIMLSASAAKALFGNADPMDKPLKISTDRNVKVTGIYEDFPKNSQFSGVDFFSSWDYFVATNAYMKQKKWDNHAVAIFVEIKPEISFAQASASIKNSELDVIKHLDGMKEEAATHPQMWIHPMKNWHLYSDFKNGVADSGPVEYIWMLGLIGFFVIFLACINFINLSTARSEKRAKEVGIRKAVGSLRSQLIGQFFTESFLVVILSFFVALCVTAASLTWFNNLSAKQMIIPWGNLYFWLFSLGFIWVTGLLAGSYPALYLTSFQPVKVLKGSWSLRIQGGLLAALPRKVLVVTQFVVSITLIICTIVIYSQIQFAKNRPVGYSREGLLMVEMKSGDFYGKTNLLRTELKNTGVVTEIAESQSPITGVWSENGGFRSNGKFISEKEAFATLSVSTEYAKTVGWQFVEGRNFSKELASDTAGFIINETAARLLKLANKSVESPVGEIISWQSSWMTNNIEKQFKVLGVVKDMVMISPFENIKPTVFFLFGAPNWINICIDPNVSTSVALPKIEAVFKQLVPTAPFDYKFADQEYAVKFAGEERMSKLATLFASIAIFISCLGLFGLASFVAEQRTKEIGIRKVLGATVANLWKMLSQDFVLLVVIAFLISGPASWYFMNKWLMKYNYHTEISWWIFAVTAIGALLITLITVSSQAIKAALMNPVKSLKSE
ncbi:ABC transporter permease [Dyadobacter subterraneus]|uniref:ABC transporter permease n=1 Tax=Dyadobacter subterraneus TaxID=2773304 RepID=A0ABR9W9W5_9BACT|nr:ABC transporter permease [Dyadobacter subterraneus]MBE9462278.1 ABC transporter permease [Dyadobacter subterraneus]